MAYTPINWQTGDTITAEKLNKMDNGWGTESTQLFSETVTTADDGGFNVGTLAYSDFIDSDTLAVTFDGTDYMCNNSEPSGSPFTNYGAPWSDTLGGYDFTEYPFNLSSGDGGPNEITTETAGTHTISSVGSAIVTSADFDSAAQLAIASTIAAIKTPYLVTVGTTTWAEVNSALKAGRTAFVWNHATINNQPDTYEFVAEAKYTVWKVYTLAVVGGAVVVNTYQASSQTSALELVTS